MIELDKISGSLEKTGFPLEYYVGSQFSKRGWRVLSNRYYVDDIDGKPRELDLMAYRSKPVGEFRFTFVVLVSCKKDAENRWVFLSRPKPKTDPNIDWNPIHWWTNHGLLDAYMADGEWKQDFLLSSGDSAIQWYGTERDVFASQLIAPNGAVKNDKPIFDSVSGLMKAMVHERSAIQARVTKKRLYLFVNLTVVDASLVEAAYEASPIAVSERDQVTLLSNYIVANKPIGSVVHFIQKDKLIETISGLNDFFKEAHSYFKQLNERAYSEFSGNKSVQKHFSALFEKDLLWYVNFRARESGVEAKIESANFEFRGGELNIDMDVFSDDLEKLNENEKLTARIRKWLEDNPKYLGPFKIESEIPF